MMDLLSVAICRTA